MAKLNNATIRFASRFAFGKHFSCEYQRITIKYRIWKLGTLEAQVTERGPLGSLCHRSANQQTQGIQAIYDHLSINSVGCKFLIKMQRLCIPRHLTKPNIVLLNHYLRGFVGIFFPYCQLLKIFTCHCVNLMLLFVFLRHIVVVTRTPIHYISASHTMAKGPYEYRILSTMDWTRTIR